MNNITVSIFILTYNQEQFIAQTIESVLSQVTDFNFQLVIGEDNSTDSTRAICQNYAKNYSEKIKLLPALDYNLGLIKNYIRTIKECDGKYIAICDGDDYWTDHYKLQMQVDFLENNTEFSIVYTNVLKLFPNGEFKDFIIKPKSSISDFDDLIYDNFIPSVTVLFRNKQTLGEIPSWIENFPYGDWPTYLWTIKDGGKIHFLNEVTAIYRMNIGVSSKIRKINSNIIKINLRILNHIFEDINFIHRKELVLKVILEKELNLMSSYNRERKYYMAFKQYINNLKRKGANNNTKMYLYSIYKSLI